MLKTKNMEFHIDYDFLSYMIYVIYVIYMIYVTYMIIWLEKQNKLQWKPPLCVS